MTTTSCSAEQPIPVCWRDLPDPRARGSAHGGHVRPPCMGAHPRQARATWPGALGGSFLYRSSSVPCSVGSWPYFGRSGCGRCRRRTRTPGSRGVRAAVGPAIRSEAPGLGRRRPALSVGTCPAFGGCRAYPPNHQGQLAADLLLSCLCERSQEQWLSMEPRGGPSHVAIRRHEHAPECPALADGGYSKAGAPQRASQGTTLGDPVCDACELGLLPGTGGLSLGGAVGSVASRRSTEPQASPPPEAASSQVT